MKIQVILARAGLLVFLVIGFLIHQLSPEEIESFLHGIPYRCPLRWITGWKCAFCGMTHSWIAIFRGDWATAFHENIFGLPLWIVTVSGLGIYSFNKKINLNWKPVLTISFGFLVIYAFLRNLL